MSDTTEVQQTPHDGADGFLLQRQSAEMFRIQRAQKRLCRHCGAPMKFTSRGAFLCAGVAPDGRNSCDTSGGKAPPYKPPPTR